jgi:GxxExxY protein
MPLNPAIPHSDLTYRIIGCAMRVHNRLGPGLKEHHYQKAMTAEMLADNLRISEEHHFEVYDDQEWIGRLYFDHMVEDQVVLEIKAFVHLLTKEEVAQVITYLAASSLKVGLLINFGRKRLEYRRILAPKDVTDWQQHVRRYVWHPPSTSPLPETSDPESPKNSSTI